MKEKNARPKKYRQNNVKQHFHPRGLARSVVHSMMAREDMYGVNKVAPGGTQSAFGKSWRAEADRFAVER